MRVAISAPYFCQYDNVLYPGGSCNMTSLGMALAHYGSTVPGPYPRIPDNLLDYCDQNGLDRHALEVIASVARHFGIADDASYTTSFDAIKQHLEGGNLVVVQGTFTPSGHVILVCGFDEGTRQWLCNDPAGHWPHYSNPGWEPGDQVWYDSDWFRAKAAPDGEVWAHLLAPVGASHAVS